MKEAIVLIIAVFAAASSAWANLGDSGDKIEDSYGTVIQRRLREDETVSVMYEKMEISIWSRLLMTGVFPKAIRM